jgi:hypothetical protein
VAEREEARDDGVGGRRPKWASRLMKSCGKSAACRCDGACGPGAP